MVLKPPPDAPKPLFQTDSELYAPLCASASRWVPPTAVTSGSDAGVDALSTNESGWPSHVGCAAPWSPDDANSVIPFAGACGNTSCCWATSAGAMQASAAAKLCEMTSPRLLSPAHFVTARMSASWLLGASTRSIVAPGATTCAHSTSSEISPDQLRWLGSLT